jgi:hypothetical protein
MDEQRMLTCIWTVVVVGIVCVIATFAGCNVAQNYQDDVTMEAMVRYGADVRDARCAVKSADTHFCVIRATSKATKD